MKPKHRRLSLYCAGVAVLALAAGLVLTALEDNIVFFQSPSEVMAATVDGDRRFRLGGLVEEGSVQRVSGEEAVTFRITDGVHAVPVAYQGLLPDLFREGQGVVAEGRMGSDRVFRADTVLAKHDENYMPPEVAAALKDTGHWREQE